ncbi:Hsp20/alpha crystallin family protein [Saccharomonospora sp. NPDC046836]|uniref:Hsp20/alpha crystallin family protein n=1 Tax=Saccharomonospora sp. NPDC046836 TaxID=3156921 RepID=UPI00340D0835
MASIVPRGGLLPDVFQWLESEFPFGPRMRLEDYVADDKYVLRAELPGMDPDRDIAITVENDELTIRARRGEEKKESGRSEFHYGAYSRTVRLPVNADPSKIEARYDNGILELTVPLAKSAEKREIRVNRA